MLVLSRRIRECFLIDDQIKVTILSTRGNQVRVGIEAPSRVRVLREELIEKSPDVNENEPPLRRQTLRKST